MTGNIFLTGCTHFGHKNIIEFEAASRPFMTVEAHDEYLIHAWNQTVAKNDTVYHLGDVVFPAKGFASVARLNGRKKLILGNHDRHPMLTYAKYFEVLGGCARLDDVLLSHYPVNASCLGFAERFNAHCHIHSRKIEDNRFVNVSVEHWNLRPVAYDTVRDKFLADFFAEE